MSSSSCISSFFDQVNSISFTIQQDLTNKLEALDESISTNQIKLSQLKSQSPIDDESVKHIEDLLSRLLVEKLMLQEEINRSSHNPTATFSIQADRQNKLDLLDNQIAINRLELSRLTAERPLHSNRINFVENILSKLAIDKSILQDKINLSKEKKITGADPIHLTRVS